MTCGLVCRGCGVNCSDMPTQQEPLEIECPSCGGSSKLNGLRCVDCDNGYVRITQCPRREIGSEFIREIKLVNHAIDDKLLPDSGGINDQNARFVHLWQAYKSEVNMIQRKEET